MRRPPYLLFALAALTLPTASLHAAERVTLQNGFEVACHHHASTQNHVRLYMGAGQDSYIEVAQTDIASIETVADPVMPVPEAPVAALASALAPASPEGSLSVTDLHEMLATAGHTHHLDVDLLASVVKAESGGNVRAVSRTGARGLMQLMPQTAAGLGVEDSFRPEQNIRGGSTYLDGLLTRYHDNLALALAAYNAGPAAVDKYHGIPPYRETRLYVARVIHEFNRRVLTREAQAHAAPTSQAQRPQARAGGAIAASLPKAGGR